MSDLRFRRELAIKASSTGVSSKPAWLDRRCVIWPNSGSRVSSVGAPEVTVTIEIEAKLPQGASDQLVRTVTENSRTLKFTSHGFEKE